jgi:membrane associated rhomboid family serine protease
VADRRYLAAVDPRPVDPAIDTVCYRHPDRAAGVSCQRCDRPICPQCMVQASVGFQCPECVRARPQRVVPARTVFARGSEVVVGKWLIGLNAAMFLLAAAGGSATRASGPFAQRTALFGPAVADGEWWRIVTGGFMHAGVLHLAMNMFLLWLLSQELEPALGRMRFLLLYAVSLFGGALGVMLIDPNALTVGASGAIFGLMGALVVLQLRAHQNPWQSGIGGLVAINVVITFLIPGISIGGHLGGLVAGALAGLLVTPLAWPQENAKVKDGFLVVAGLLVAAGAVMAAERFAAPLPAFF